MCYKGFRAFRRVVYGFKGGLGFKAKASRFRTQGLVWLSAFNVNAEGSGCRALLPADRIRQLPQFVF